MALSAATELRDLQQLLLSGRCVVFLVFSRKAKFNRTGNSLPCLRPVRCRSWASPSRGMDSGTTAGKPLLFYRSKVTQVLDGTLVMEYDRFDPKGFRQEDRKRKKHSFLVSCIPYSLPLHRYCTAKELLLFIMVASIAAASARDVEESSQNGRLRKAGSGSPPRTAAMSSCSPPTPRVPGSGNKRSNEAGWRVALKSTIASSKTTPLRSPGI